MSFLFPKPKAPQQSPTPAPPPPAIGDAASEAAAREARNRSKKKRGVDSTILTGLGSGESNKATLLGQTPKGEA